MGAPLCPHHGASLVEIAEESGVLKKNYRCAAEGCAFTLEHRTLAGYICKIFIFPITPGRVRDGLEAAGSLLSFLFGRS